MGMFPGAVLVLAGLFFSIVGLFTAVEWRSGHRWWRRVDLSTDVIWAVFTVAGIKQIGKFGVAVAAVVIGVGVLGADVDQLTGLREWFLRRETVVSRLPLGLQIPLGLLVHDFASYWMHRLFHASARLWPFHAVHHSPRQLDWLASLRVHPVNDVLQKTMSAVPLLVMGFQPVLAAGFAPLLVLYALLLHADVDWSFGPLSRVIASPRFHRWHHANEVAFTDNDQARRGRNFAGLFPVWDLMFGTFSLPARSPARTGVDDDVPANPVGQLFWAFGRAVRPSR